MLSFRTPLLAASLSALLAGCAGQPSLPQAQATDLAESAKAQAEPQALADQRFLALSSSVEGLDLEVSQRGRASVVIVETGKALEAGQPTDLLSQLSQSLAGVLAEGEHTIVRVVAYADSDTTPIDTYRTSRESARAVANALQANGVAEGRVRTYAGGSAALTQGAPHTRGHLVISVEPLAGRG